MPTHKFYSYTEMQSKTKPKFQSEGHALQISKNKRETIIK